MRRFFTLASSIALFLISSSAATAQRPELVVQAGHRESPRSVAFAPDGRTFVTGSRDRAVKLWETATGRLVRGLEANAYLSPEGISFAPDGATLAVVTCDASVDLWDVARASVRRSLKSPDYREIDIARLSPDGRRLFVSNAPGWRRCSPPASPTANSNARSRR